MLKVNESFCLAKLKYWGFNEFKGKWYKDIDKAGWLLLEIGEDKEVKINFTAGEDVKEDYEFTIPFDKVIYDLIKAEVFVWNS